RPGTLAAKKLKDDVPLETKKTRLNEIIAIQNKVSLQQNLADIGKTFKVLIEGNSKKSEMEWKGRNSQNKMVVFPKIGNEKPGNYVWVTIRDVNSATLLGDQTNN
ncbi:MAG TPA: TRAM domain-containing protein, partial [Saprospiraceae bacterium]|nr:TRAM domain-containing protein [Saprospiraceae bacterium]